MKRIHTLLRSPDPVKWLFYGDSITHGAFHTMGWRDYTELFSERIRYELRRSNDVVIKTAYDGNTTKHLVEFFQWRVEQFQPQVVFIMIGMNDCCMESEQARVPLDEFRANIDALVGRIRSLNCAVPVLQTCCPLWQGGALERQKNLGPYMTAVRQLARDAKLPLVDHFSYWKKQFKAGEGANPFWMSDAIHPNEMGHRVFAELIFKKLKIYDSKSPTCRLFHP